MIATTVKRAKWQPVRIAHVKIRSLMVMWTSVSPPLGRLPHSTMGAAGSTWARPHGGRLRISDHMSELGHLLVEDVGTMDEQE